MIAWKSRIVGYNRLPFLSLFLIVLALFTGCADKYKAYKSLYKFKSEDGRADYTKLDYWAAHPWKWDPSDSVPEPLRSQYRDSVVDVFFVHPTSYTRRKKDNQSNAPIDYDYINAKTDYSSVLYQASAFNQLARVFAPRYRQAHITNFFHKDKVAANKAFALAYEDVKQAFEYYLQHWNKGRPIIIAAHSQGSMMSLRLLKDYFENKPLYNKLVAAYTIGWPVPKDYFSAISICADSLQTGCICSWRTLRNGFIPFYLKEEKGNSFVTNPLTWRTDEEYAPRRLNKGSVLFDFNKIYRRTTDARIRNGLLYVKRPKFPGSWLYFTRNYHIGDINLYFINIRENVEKRIGMFWKK